MPPAARARRGGASAAPARAAARSPSLRAASPAPRASLAATSAPAAPAPAPSAPAPSAPAPAPSLAFLRAKAAWLPPGPRALLAATRPWSVPASLVPGVLAALLVLDGAPSRRVEQLGSAVLPVLTGVLAHLGANLVNTYFDHSSGLDKAATADDRTLVDGTVSRGAVAGAAVVCFAAAAAAAAACVVAAGAALLWPVVIGFALAVFYTAAPLSLKYVGLGDATIFLAFGPLLMTAVAGAVTRAPLQPAAVAAALAARSLAPLGLFGPLLAMSLAVGVLTLNILHANNVRDLPLDRAARALTPVVVVGLPLARALYSAYFVAAYALALVAVALRLTHLYAAPSLDAVLAAAAASVRGAAALGGPAAVAAAAALPRSSGAAAAGAHLARAAALLVTLTAPWAVALVGRMSRNELATLPQSTAQFDLFFGATLVVALLPLPAAGRVCLGILFYLGGVQNVLQWHHTRLLVAQKLGDALGLAAPLPPALAQPAAALATAAQMAASAVFMLGAPGTARPAAAVLAAVLVTITPAVHTVWSAGHDAQAERRDPAAASVEAYAAAMGAPVARSTAAPPAPGGGGGGAAGATVGFLLSRDGKEIVADLLDAEVDGDGRDEEEEEDEEGEEEEVEEEEPAPSSARRRGGARARARAPAPSPARARARARAPAPALRSAVVALAADALLQPPIVTLGAEPAAGGSAAAAASDAPVMAPPGGLAGGVPTFASNFDNEFVHFFKNCGMLGGLLLFLAYAPE